LPNQPKISKNTMNTVRKSYFWAQMSLASARYFLLFIILCISVGCANIVPPAGGKKDTTPPKRIAITPADSQLNTRVSKIEMHFNEFVTVSDITTEVQVSPLLPIPISVVATGKRVNVKIPDSLLQENTTYRISFGRAIKDLHEGNPMKPYTYTFSTGSYFDSLQLNGTVIDAATGRPDTGVFILLYDASESDSAVVRKKPKYIGRVGNGSFSVQGLPYREFKIYALKDANANLIYDGKGEKIGFIDSTVFPADSAGALIVIKTFAEDIKDTSTKPKESAFKRKKPEFTKDFFYNVSVDTTNINKGSYDITKPLQIQFNKSVDTFNKGRVYLNYDSLGIAVEAPFTLDTDTVRKDILLLNTNWKENAIYTLRLLKGFAKDSARAEVNPSRYTFRTRSDDDYSKLTIHLPTKYNSTKYVLLVRSETDTVYMKPVTDTMVHLTKLKPGAYSMFVIVDKNGNGKWDTGDLFEKLHAEDVIPFDEAMQLKAGWDNTYDFEKIVIPKPGKGSSPGKRDKAPVK
jgi:hypothetical protein